MSAKSASEVGRRVGAWFADFVQQGKEKSKEGGGIGVGGEEGGALGWGGGSGAGPFLQVNKVLWVEPQTLNQLKTTTNLSKRMAETCFRGPDGFGFKGYSTGALTVERAKNQG